MLEKLRALVFGLDEYTKTKIDVRFQFIEELVPKLHISSIDDFEIIESCIYKIKDQLRVKSSNLNKVIRDRSNKLTSSYVQQILSSLLSIRNEFLQKAFSAIEHVQDQSLEQKPSLLEQELEEQSIESDQSMEQNSLDNLKQDEYFLEKEQKTEENTQEKTSSITIIELPTATITLEAESTPFLLIHFKDVVSYQLLKQVSSLFFEITHCHGTSILIEGKKAMVIARFDNDGVLPVSTAPIVNDLQEEFSQLLKHQENKAKGVQDVQVKEVSSLEPSITPVVEKKQTISTKKHQEESLDELLFSKESTHEHFEKRPNPKEDNDPIVFEKDDSIEIEKKPAKIELEGEKIETYVQETQNPELREETQKSRQETRNLERREDGGIAGNLNHENAQSLEEGANGTREESGSREGGGFLKNELLIYEDDQINVYLREDSASIGHLLIEDKEQKPFSQLKENQISYMMLFAKVFSTVVFETLQAHGTSIVWKYSSSAIEVIPRFKDDTILPLFQGNEANPQELESIAKQLLFKLQESIGTGGSQHSSQKKEEPEKELSPEERKKKAEYILKALRKIP
jgi:diadenosine tetraphosphate (Ap4A) HIT family hydrolase